MINISGASVSSETLFLNNDCVYSSTNKSNSIIFTSEDIFLSLIPLNDIIGSNLMRYLTSSDCGKKDSKYLSTPRTRRPCIVDSNAIVFLLRSEERRVGTQSRFLCG